MPHNRSSVPLLASTVAFAALWLLLRRAPRSQRFVRAVELSTLFVGTAAISTVAVVMDLVAGEAKSEPALTMDNAITGTPLYIAPEAVVAPETVDARTDLYALGAVGYWLLTGTHVFGGKSILEVVAQHLHSVPEAPSTRLGAPVSSDLEAVLLACLAKRPEDRPASAHVLRERLRACAAAGRWTNARAAQWWALHRHELRSGAAKNRAFSAAPASQPSYQQALAFVAETKA